MKKEELDSKLKKYYDGSCSEDDEKELKDFFTHGDISEGYEAEKAMFRYFIETSEIPEPSADLDENIIAALDKVSVEKSLWSGRYTKALSGAAAGIIVIMGTLFLFNRSSELPDTYTDPEIAYAETIRVLNQVSDQLSQGITALEPVSKINSMKKLVEESSENYEKSLRNLERLQKAIELTNDHLKEQNNQ